MRISKKLSVLTATIALVVFEKKLGLELDDQMRNQIIVLASSYLVGQGMADFGKEKAR